MQNFLKRENFNSESPTPVGVIPIALAGKER
jgi:hypothetical protein